MLARKTTKYSTKCIPGIKYWHSALIGVYWMTEELDVVEGMLLSDTVCKPRGSRSSFTVTQYVWPTNAVQSNTSAKTAAY